MEHAHAHATHHRAHGTMPSAPSPAGQHGQMSHHAHMVADFRKRFWVCFWLTFPMLALSDGAWGLLGLKQLFRFPGDPYLLFVLSSVAYFYSGWPFLAGFVDETRKHQPGMMTSIAVAISVAYLYSTQSLPRLPRKASAAWFITAIHVKRSKHLAQNSQRPESRYGLSRRISKNRLSMKH